MVRTGLEDTLSSDALAVGAEADATEDSAICKFKDSIHYTVFVLEQGCSDGWGREAVRVVGSRASEDWPDGVYFEGGVRESHGRGRLWYTVDSRLYARVGS